MSVLARQMTNLVIQTIVVYYMCHCASTRRLETRVNYGHVLLNDAQGGTTPSY